MSGLLIAQESVTSATVKWFIVALLVVAALLTVLTVWYWRHTDPYRRLASTRQVPVDRAPQPRTAPAAPAPGAGGHGWPGGAPASASDAAAEARRRAAAAGPAPSAGGYVAGAATAFPPSSPPAAADDLEADDWLRLTGPQALPRDGV